jgi:ADP-ribose pyrophosphatase
MWAIPGGLIELGETLQDAAEREIKEETGISIRAGRPFHTFDLIRRDENGNVETHYIIVDLEADYLAGTPKADDDAIDARWIGPMELKNLEVTPTTLAMLKTIGFHDSSKRLI